MDDNVEIALLGNQDGSTCCAIVRHVQNSFAAKVFALQGVKSIQMS